MMKRTKNKNTLLETINTKSDFISYNHIADSHDEFNREVSFEIVHIK